MKIMPYKSNNIYTYVLYPQDDTILFTNSAPLTSTLMISIYCCQRDGCHGCGLKFTDDKIIVVTIVPYSLGIQLFRSGPFTLWSQLRYSERRREK